MLYITIALFGFLFGSAMGSAWLCLLARMNSHESWISGRSHCDSCNHVLNATDLIPIVSYLAYKGKCRYCGAVIPKITLYAELVFGITYAVAFALVFYSIHIYIEPALRVAVACMILFLIIFPFEFVKSKIKIEKR